ncbi:MAG: hypothetical protein ABIQ21_20330 [Chryseolinea sp.]
MAGLLDTLTTSLFNLFRFIDADPVQLQAIVSLKLKTDNRRQHVSYRNKIQKDPKLSFLITIFVYGLMGIFFGLLIIGIKSFILVMVTFFSYLIIMIGMTLITDFSSILLDTSDNTIILPRPVSGRTLYIARLIHIMLYLSQLTIGLSIVPSLAVYFSYGAGALFSFLVLIVCGVLIALLLTNAAYLLILRFSSEENLRSIINYFQIAMAVLLMAGYQILPRAGSAIGFDSTEFHISWWYLLVPPVWLAATMESVYYGIVDAKHIAMAFCAIVVPSAGTYVVSKYLTPLFNKKLGALVVDREIKTKKLVSKSWLKNISRLINRSVVERASFELVYRIVGRDRKIKLKIYPTIGYMFVFGLAWFLNDKSAVASVLEHSTDTRYHVVLFYLPFFIVQVACHEIAYSDDFKASWIYFSAPFKTPGEVLSGMIKAVMLRFFVPAYAVISIFLLAVWGINSIDEIVFGLLNNYLMTMTLMSIQKHYLPFSMSPNVRNQSGEFMRTILASIIIGIMGFGHYLLTTWPIFMDVLIPVQLTVAIYLHQAYRKITWDDVTL